MNSLFIINKYRIYNVILASLYFFFMIYVYMNFISKIYEYSGFYKDFNFVNIVIAFIAVLVIYFAVPCENDLHYYYHLMLAVLFVPSMVLFSVGSPGLSYFFANFICISIVIAVPYFIRVKSLKVCEVNLNLILYAFVFVVLVYFLGIIFKGGLGYFNLNFKKVYELRSLSATNLGGLYDYASPVVGKIVVPLLIVLSAIKKKWFFLILGVLSSVLIFSFTSHKSPLFYPVLILIFYYFSKKNFSIYILLGCIFVVVVSILDFVFIEYTGGWFGSIFVRRALLVPSYLNYCYIDFFTGHTPYFWSESKITFGQVASPYQLKTVNLIGDIYFNKPDMSANAGWIGSGFANASWYGAIFYSFLVGLLVSFLASFGKAIDGRFVFASSSIVLLAILTSTDLITSLMTHGLIFLIFIFFLIPRNALT